MSRQTIDGKCLAMMLKGGAKLLSEHASEVNDLNVFPVPDGDTGTNMTLTLEGGISRIGGDGSDSVADTFGKFANGALMGARGNSGVILSQMFAGINEELSLHETVDATALAKAYESGVKKAYLAVQKPTEGTILTVFRESAEYARDRLTSESTVEDFFTLLIEKARESLEHTKELLPVLAEADVVDSGGQGYLYMTMGMLYALTGRLDAASYQASEHPTAQLDIDSFTKDSVLEFGYCTEFMLRLTTAKTDPDSFSTEELIASFEKMGGESIVAYKDSDLVKVHVHTFAPGEVLTHALRFGELLTVKIENMSLGHTETRKTGGKKQKKPYALVAVATGEGICALFEQMGVDAIVRGGQTCNPSTEELINAFRSCEAKEIIVLPNNKNVLLAATQAAELYTEARVRIVPTKSLMQGYGALSVITPGITDLDMLVENAKSAAEGVEGAEITRAVREVSVKGTHVNEGDYIAIRDGEICALSDSAESAVTDMLDGLNMDDYELITLFVGRDVSDEKRAEFTEILEKKYPDCRLTVYVGGQDVYDYLVAVE